MKKRPTILIDMDGVMADFDGAALIYVPEELRVPRQGFYVSADYPPEIRQQIETTYNTPGFFETLEPLPGLLEAWQAMIDHGYHPQVASAPLSSNPTSEAGKRAWLSRVMVPAFGPSVVEEAIIDKEKWRYEGLALIDDRPVIPRGPATSSVATWEHILFGWEHTETITSLSNASFRLLSWHDTDTLLHTLDQIERRAS